MNLAEGYEPPVSFVPKHHAYALQTLAKRKPSDGSKRRMIPQHLRQPIIGDPAT